MLDKKKQSMKNKRIQFVCIHSNLFIYIYIVYKYICFSCCLLNKWINIESKQIEAR